MPGEYTFYAGSKLLQPFADTVGTSVDKVNFTLCLFLSLPLAIFYYRRFPVGKTSREIRLAVPLLLGLTICFFCYGHAIKHLLANALVCYGLLQYAPVHLVHKLVFVSAMAYLTFIHWYRWYILTSYTIDITGPMMLLVQKVTSLAFSLNDGQTKSESEMNEIQRKEAIREVPSLLEYMSYVFHFQAVLCGPLCFYADYIAFIDGTAIPKTLATLKNGNNNKIVLPIEDAAKITPWAAVTEKVVWSVIFFVLALFVCPSYPIDALIDPKSSLENNSWIYRLAYLYFSILLVRTQYYMAWLMADGVCNASGFGFDGFTKDGRSTWDLISNVKVWDFETAGSWKESLDAWNCTTMQWLRRVAYDRTPPRYRVTATYLLSAWWHGFFPGYYLTFLSGALFTTAARQLRRSLRPRLRVGDYSTRLYDVWAFLLTKVVLAYATFPFMLMRFQPAFDLYSRMFFYQHIIGLIVVFILPKILPAIRRSPEDVKTE